MHDPILIPNTVVHVECRFGGLDFDWWLTRNLPFFVVIRSRSKSHPKLAEKLIEHHQLIFSFATWELYFARTFSTVLMMHCRLPFDSPSSAESRIIDVFGLFSRSLTRFGRLSFFRLGGRFCTTLFEIMISFGDSVAI